MSQVFVAGHNGLVGSAIRRRLASDGVEVLTANRSEMDLTDQASVDAWFADHSIDQVYLAAAKVGGIHANDTYPAEFLHDNLVIQTNIIHASYENNVNKLLFLGSACIYPKTCPQPIEEKSLLSNYLEPTNEPYAIAKIAGLKMCQSYNREYDTRYISVMPNNLYGTNDNFDLETSHVLPALIRKFHLAKLASAEDWEGIKKEEAVYGEIPPDIKTAIGLDSVTDMPVRQPASQPSVVLWGTGAPRREFLHVDDLAAACVFLMNNYHESEIINIGWGKDKTILDLAKLISKVVGYQGDIRWDNSKPDGTPQKLLDVSKLTGLGWQAGIELEEGIRRVYQWYLDQVK